MPERRKAKRTHNPIVREMTDGLREIYDEVRSVYDSMQSRDMASKYRIGQLVNRIKSDPQKYGQRGVEQLAQAIGRHWTVLYRWAQVADWFDPEEFNELRKERRQGFGISFKHLEILAVVKTSPDERRLIDRVFAERMNTDALTDAVNKLFDRGPGPAERKRGPRSPRAGLKSMISFAKEFQKSCEGLDAGFFEKFEEIDPKKLTDHLELIKEAEAKEQAVLERAQANVLELQKARMTLEKKLADEKARDRSPETPAKRPRKRVLASA